MPKLTSVTASAGAGKTTRIVRDIANEILTRPPEEILATTFTIKAAAWYGADVSCPPQYLPGKEQIFRNSVRDRQDFEDLKIKGKPKTRAELKAEATKPLAAE